MSAFQTDHANIELKSLHFFFWLIPLFSEGKKNPNSLAVNFLSTEFIDPYFYHLLMFFLHFTSTNLPLVHFSSWRLPLASTCCSCFPPPGMRSPTFLAYQNYSQIEGSAPTPLLSAALPDLVNHSCFFLRLFESFRAPAMFRWRRGRRWGGRRRKWRRDGDGNALEMCKRLHSGLLQSNLMLAEPASKLLSQ